MLSRAAGLVRFLIRSFREYRNEDSILIYQMGKVGSTSLAAALGPEALQIHNFFASNEPCSQRPRYGSGLHKATAHWLFYRAIRQAVRRRERLRIITLVRDPVGRNVSMYFHHLYYWLAYYFSELKPGRENREDVDVLVDCFREAFDHRYPLDWFDRELKRLTGLDVYDHAFDPATGYARMEKGRISLLVVRTDKLGECWQAIEEFCGRKLERRAENRGARKWYAPLYSEFLDRFALTASELDEIYSSKYATLFFSEEERASLKRKWQGRG